MKRAVLAVLVTMVMVFASGAAFAADFDWLKELNIQAKTDLSGFKARLGARFKVGDTEINTVISNVEEPADAYMVFKFGEMSGEPVDTVEKKYKAGKHQGWGALAKSLGIKPGSPEFHALKKGHDLDSGRDADAGKGKGKSKKEKKHKKNKEND